MKLSGPLLTGGAEAHQPKSAKDHYREEFFKALDTVDAHFTERFNQDGLLTLQKLEETLLSGEVEAPVIDKYSELNSHFQCRFLCSD